MKTQYGLKPEIIKAIHEVFVDFPEVTKVILYGSRAMGNFRKGSDIDLTLIEEGMSFERFLALENKLDDLLLPWKIDISRMQKITNRGLIDHIDRVGKVFFVKQ
jgi:predicted nucleotidyltransferase